MGPVQEVKSDFRGNAVYMPKTVPVGQRVAILSHDAMHMYLTSKTFGEETFAVEEIPYRPHLFDSYMVWLINHLPTSDAYLKQFGSYLFTAQATVSVLRVKHTQDNHLLSHIRYQEYTYILVVVSDIGRVANGFKLWYNLAHLDLCLGMVRRLFFRPHMWTSAGGKPSISPLFVLSNAAIFVYDTLVFAISYHLEEDGSTAIKSGWHSRML